MFVAGSVVAFERHRLASLQELGALRGRAGIVKVATLVVTVGLLSCYWPVYALHLAPRITAYLAAAARGLEVLGACTVIVLLLQESAGQRLFERPVVQWLGRRSFSIYLVHVPIMVSLALVLGGRPPLWLLTPVVVVCSLIIAAWFYRLVERPTLHAARSIGSSPMDRRQPEVQQPRAKGAVSAVG
jgi:peptidoglycan/LPS O-acetylase OafA/YrhL